MKADFFDWTKQDGASNRSELYDGLSRAIENIIRESAHLLINGQVDDVARLIVAQLAHKYKFVPSTYTEREVSRG